ncbi:RNA methyltransferase [Terrarubrum flagellatum]|uniref:class I SAM-dependent RNA methyltransferase n=1 Tax=Terrirubrum flagellatum TaxID=2895980 RepID=UPI003144FE02
MNAASPLKFTIDHLGHRGDGVAMLGAQEIFTAYALPGERVRVERIGEDRARLIDVLDASPQRVEPICDYFTHCGGCALQHLDLAALLHWKRSLVIEALRQRGIETDVVPCVDAHGEGRRRVTLHIRATQRGVEAGFMEARSHRLIAIESCPVLSPTLADAMLVATEIGRLLGAKKPLDAQVTATMGGLDVDVRGHGKIDDALRLKLTALGEKLGLARLSLHGEILAAWRAPSLRMGTAIVTPPAGGFLQATAAGEEALARLALEGVGAAKHVVDLFSGCGPLALRLAERARVHAFELEKLSIDSLLRAARATQGLKPVAADARDLFRRPLLAQELNAFGAIVFDPPRAGAEAQAKMLAAARKPKTIVGVSCNPATFARDARILIDGGWRLVRVTPVDQFRYSAHIELVGVFRR